MSTDPKTPLDPTTPPAPQPPPKKKRRFSRLTIILGIIILLFACGAFASIFNGGDDEPTAEVAEEVEATNQPAPTDEPEEEATAEPTDEPTSAPTETPPTATPADPEEALRAAIDEALGESNRDLGRKLTLFDVRADEGSISVGWAADDNFGNDLIVGGMQLDTVDILQAIDDAGIPYDWVFLGSSFAMQDQFGNAEEMDVLTLSYQKSTIDRINWDNFLFSNVFDIADAYVLHPAFQTD